MTMYDHTDCEYEEIQETIHIECKDCIENIRQPRCCKTTGFTDYEIDCKCFDKIITKKVCRKCEDIKEQMDILNNELDEILYFISYEIRRYNDSIHLISRLGDISTKLRLYNNMLLINSQ